LFANTTHQLSLETLTPKQYLKIKEPVVNIDNQFNKVFPFFDLFNKKFALRSRLIDIFPSCFFFHSSNKQSNNSIKMHIHYLNNISLKSSIDFRYALVVSNTSIKNHVATSIAHIHVHNKPVIKTLHHAVNITSTKAELFTIRCGINQATDLPSIEKIIIITDSIHIAKRIFDSSSYPFQIHAVAISNELRKFFVKNHDNSIDF